MTTQAITNEWQLDRIDQRDLPLDDEYTYERTGAGVTVYIVDSGVRATHDDFDGRVEDGVSVIGEDPHVDNENHGTAVASGAAGTVSGVAKGAAIVPVQVYSNLDPWTNGQAISGLDWILANHPGGPAVINMSAGVTSFAISGLLDLKVREVIAAGFVFVVAAMNSGTDAGSFSPARVREAITVGALESDDSRLIHTLDSNYGPAVDIWSPGLDNWVAQGTGDSDYGPRYATSHATPIVTGVAALLLEEDPTLTPRQVRDALVQQSTKGRLSALEFGSPNRLVWSHTSAQTFHAGRRASYYRPRRVRR